MRKILFSLAAAGTALAVAAPASAQYFPQPQPAYGYNNGYGNTGYGNGYGYGYGQNYGQNYGQVRSLQYRIDGVQRQIEQLKARRMISRGEARGLRSESRNLEVRLGQASRYGLNPVEARNIEYGIVRLERHVAQEARNGRGYGYNNGYNNGQYGNGYNSGYNGYGYNNGSYADRDHDGRDDNDEHDRWHAQHDDNNDD